MYICVCNAITERQVRDSVAAGAVTLTDLQFDLGVATCCGCCAQTAQDYLPGGRYAADGNICSVVEFVTQPGNSASNHLSISQTSSAA